MFGDRGFSQKNHRHFKRIGDGDDMNCANMVLHGATFLEEYFSVPGLKRFHQRPNRLEIGGFARGIGRKNLPSKRQVKRLFIAAQNERFAHLRSLGLPFHYLEQANGPCIHDATKG